MKSCQEIKTSGAIAERLLIESARSQRSGWNRSGGRVPDDASVLRVQGAAPFRLHRGLLTLDSLVDFFAVNGDVFGSVYSETRLIALDAE